MMKMMNELKAIVKWNEKTLAKTEDYNKLITLSFEGMAIYNPTLDESMMNDVDPIGYYGEENINEFIKKGSKKVKKK